MQVTVTTHHTGNRRVTHFVMDNSTSSFVHESTFEFYNLSVDLSEKNNLYVDKDGWYAAQMAQMYTIMLIEEGPCPTDKEEPFVLSDDDGKSVDCNWFQESTSRCDDHVEGRLYCNSMCASKTFKAFCNSTSKLPEKPFFASCHDVTENFQYRADTDASHKVKVNCGIIKTTKETKNLDLCWFKISEVRRWIMNIENKTLGIT